MQRAAVVRSIRLSLLIAIALVAPDGHAEPAPPAAGTLATGRFATLHALLEKTFLRIDVLKLDITVGRDTAQRLATLINGRRYSDALADQAAQVLIPCEDALAHVVFLRGISLNQFLTGVRDNLDCALRAGIMTREQHRMVLDSVPSWFGFLRERGIEEGDTLFYRIRGDSVHTQMRDARGHVLLDRTDVGVAGRLGVLGGYLAPGSELREDLLRSLF